MFCHFSIMCMSVTLHLGSRNLEFIELAELVFILKSEMTGNDEVMADVEGEQEVVHRLMA